MPSGDVTIRPTRVRTTRRPTATLRLEALQTHPEAFGTDYETSRRTRSSTGRSGCGSGAGGAHGVTYVADASGALIGMTVLVRKDMVENRARRRDLQRLYAARLARTWAWPRR